MVPVSMVKGGGYGKGKGWGKDKGPASWARSRPAEQKVWLGGFPEGNENDKEFNKKLKEHMGEGCKFVEISRKGVGFALFATEEQVANAIATLNGSTFEG